MKIISLVGARPNFMKIAPFIKAIREYNERLPELPIEHLLVHTGQHYDDRMSTAFFKALNIPEADINLGIGSGSHAEQVGNTMIAFEKVLQVEQPDWVVVVGDVNATLAGSITAKKEHVKCAHIEAGLRSGDMSMPEEINRLVTDRLSDLLFTPDPISNDNLRNEGVDDSRIRYVGNIMIDTLESNREQAARLTLEDIINDNLPFQREFHLPAEESYIVVTLHRPSNVDSKDTLTSIVNFLEKEVTCELPVIWPIHPRAKKQLVEFNLWDQIQRSEKIIL